tara:strand:- start:332 stop:568 length:237 start_codon:yes stop_codon:yes gene_type:complete
MKNFKRYVVTMDMYVYADNDYMARKNAHKMKKRINEYYPDSSTQVNGIDEQPFATLTSRKLDDYSEPLSKKKDDKLPF